MSYVETSIVSCKGYFEDSSGARVDPDVVKFKIIFPDQTEIVYTYGQGVQLVRLGAGSYQVNVDTSGKPGHYEYYFYSTGFGQAYMGSIFDVSEV